MKTIDELLKEVMEEANQNSLHRAEADVEKDEFFQLTLEERLDLLPF
jgi:hypothetical protein